MRLPDLLRLALANLGRNRTRSLATLVGVMIGVAALMALLSYGAGIQQTARNEFNNLQLYNTLRVTARLTPFTAWGGAVRQMPVALDTLPRVVLTDSLVRAFEQIDGVLAAYPEIVFPVEIAANDREAVAMAEAIPMAFARIASYQPEAGAFFAASSDSALLIAPSMARRLGFDQPEEIVGQTVEVKTAALDMRRIAQNSQAFSRGMAALPIRRLKHPMRVAGLLKEERQPISGFFRVLVPLERAKGMQKVTFFSTFDLLANSYGVQGYPAVRVQLENAEAYEHVRQAIEAQRVFVTSFREQFSRLDRLFLILDLALGVIGFIALLVATIGIANTMMMSVLERYREIGVMKAVGGDEGDLQKLFLVESAALGLGGGFAGLLVAWGLTGGIQLVVDYYLRRLGVAPIDLFYAPVLMWLAVLALALFVSLLAGLAPARRAARIEPIDALRSV